MTQDPPVSSRHQLRSNVALPWPTTLLVAIEALILLTAGVVLYCLPLWDGLRWPWALRPYNTVFLGGIYWAAFAVVSLQLLQRRWVPARLIQPMIFVFSLVLLLVSLAYPGEFNFQRRLVKSWFLVYTVVPLGAALSFAQLRRIVAVRDRSSFNGLRPSRRTVQGLRLKAIALVGYGVAMLAIPAIAAAFWPWWIDSFHARLYSAIFLATGLANWQLSRLASAHEWVVLGIAELLLGALPLWGIFNLDRMVGKIDWSLSGTWIWFGLLGLWAIAGLALIRHGLRWQRHSNPVTGS